MNERPSRANEGAAVTFRGALESRCAHRSRRDETDSGRMRASAGGCSA